MTLDEFENLLKYITPGPWKYDYGNWSVEMYDRDSPKFRDDICSLNGLDIHDGHGAGNPEDGVFIASCREWVPKLIKMVKESNELSGV